MVKLSELLIEARADIEDEENWHKGDWAADTWIESEQDLLMAGQVCAVTSLAKACIRHDLFRPEFVGEEEVPHTCDCDHCTTGYDEEEVIRDLDNVMSDFDHAALKLLNEAAQEIYFEKLPGDTRQRYFVNATDINDRAEFTHEDVLIMYQRAIDKALAAEATV